MDGNSQPLISIIVPAYNVEKYIKDCVKSIYNQNYKNIEVIIINDGSTDDSLNILKELNKTYPYKLIDQPNSGVSKSRNLGITLATGEYICFIDADDYIDKNFLTDFFKTNIVNDTLYIQNIKRNDKIISNFKAGIFDIKTDLEFLLSRNNLLYNGSPCAKLYNAEIIKSNNIIFDDSVTFGEDLIFFLKYIEHVKNLCYIDVANYNYNYNPTSASTKKHSFQTYITVDQCINHFFEFMKVENPCINKIKYKHRWEFIQSAIDKSIDFNKEKLTLLVKILDYNFLKFSNNKKLYLLYFLIKTKQSFLINYLFRK